MTINPVILEYASRAQEKQYLTDRASESLEFLIPFVVTDPHGLINLDVYIPYKQLALDLAITKSGDFENFVKEFKTNFVDAEAEIVVLKNIDRISSHKDRENWERLVKKGLKGEDLNWILDDENMSLITIPFSKIRLVCTCSRYPDFLKSAGNLGLGPDFTNFAIS